MNSDAAAYYRNQIAAYADSIRMSDFKANVAVIYGAFTIAPIMGFSDKFPPFLPLAVVLLPFVIVFFLLLVCLVPRYPGRGSEKLFISRAATPDDFQGLESNEAILDQQQALCVIHCNILYWKVVCLRISFSIYILGTVTAAVLLGYSWFVRAG